MYARWREGLCYYQLGPAVCFTLGPPDLKHRWVALVVTVETVGVSIGLSYHQHHLYAIITHG